MSDPDVEGHACGFGTMKALANSSPGLAASATLGIECQTREVKTLKGLRRCEKLSDRRPIPSGLRPLINRTHVPRVAEAATPGLKLANAFSVPQIL